MNNNQPVTVSSRVFSIFGKAQNVLYKMSVSYSYLSELANTTANFIGTVKPFFVEFSDNYNDIQNRYVQTLENINNNDFSINVQNNINVEDPINTIRDNVNTNNTINNIVNAEYVYYDNNDDNDTDVDDLGFANERDALY